MKLTIIKMSNKLKLLLLTLLFSQTVFSAPIRVVTTTMDLKNIAEIVGGDKVNATSIATGYQNLHFVDPKPSYIISLSKADVFVTVGMDLEISWSVPLLNSSRNNKIQRGGDGYVDASIGMPLLQVPVTANRAEGDIHIYGNPHYWLDPDNGKIIARNICNGLKKVDPANSAYYEANLKAFDDKIDAKMVEWEQKMAPYRGTKIIAYHNEWVYFETRFGLKIVDFMEPKPGIPPSPSQLVKVINEVKADNIKIVVSSPYYSTTSTDIVANQTGIKEVTLATSVGAYDEIKDYFDLFDYDIAKLIEILKP